MFSSNYKKPNWTLVLDGERELIGETLRVNIPKLDINRFELEFKVEINGKKYVESYPVTINKRGSK